MEVFPNNSKLPSSNIEKPRDDKKLTRVTTNDVVRRKQPLNRKFISVFLNGNIKRAITDVVSDVLVPAAKDMLTDAVTQGLERMIYGEVRGRIRRSYSVGRQNYQNHTNYTQYSSSQRALRKEETRPISSRARATHDFDEIILATRAEAEEVVDRLFDVVNRYEIATVADLYELVGITGEYTDEKWGWTDIRGADVSRVRDGYLLNLPKPEPIS